MGLNWRKIALFSDFNDKELEAVKSVAQRSTLSKGEFAFRENEPGESLMLLELGSLRLTKKTANGDEHEIITLGSGSFVGEMSLFDPGLRSTSGQALERCELTVIPLKSLRSLLEENDSMAAKFYWRLAAGIAHRLRYLNEDFASLKKFLATRG